MEKKLCCRFEQLKAEYPEAMVELWAIDEHRLGLKPVFRRVWTPKGVQPTAEVNWRFQWFWVYGASTSSIRRNLLVAFTQGQYYCVQPSVSRLSGTFWLRKK